MKATEKCPMCGGTEKWESVHSGKKKILFKCGDCGHEEVYKVKKSGGAKKWLIIFAVFIMFSSIFDMGNETTKLPDNEISGFELVAGVQGEYGTPVTFNKGTELEETIIAYHIPAGDYIATNIGDYITQLNIYSDEIHVTEFGWEEPAVSVFVKLVEVGATVEFSIEDGQYIEIAEPTKLLIEKN